MEIQMKDVLLLSTVTDALLKKVENGRVVNRKMNFRVKSRLIKASDKLLKELGPYESERVDLVKKYGEPVEDGNEALKVKEEDLPKFYEELGAILDTKTEINFDFCLLTEEDIDGIEGDVDVQEEGIRAFNKYMMVPEKDAS